MLLSLRSTEGVTVSLRLLDHHHHLYTTNFTAVIIFRSTLQAHLDEDKQFVLLDDDDDEGEEGDVILDEEGETEVDERDVAGYASL